MQSTQQRLQDFFYNMEIHPEFAEEPIRITRYNWNENEDDFIVDFWIEQRQYRFHYNLERAEQFGPEYKNIDPVKQLEDEVNYIKRMYERGIGSKEYYPFTESVVSF